MLNYCVFKKKKLLLMLNYFDANGEICNFKA